MVVFKIRGLEHAYQHAHIGGRVTPIFHRSSRKEHVYQHSHIGGRVLPLNTLVLEIMFCSRFLWKLLLNAFCLTFSLISSHKTPSSSEFLFSKPSFHQKSLISFAPYQFFLQQIFFSLKIWWKINGGLELLGKSLGEEGDFEP